MTPPQDLFVVEETPSAIVAAPLRDVGPERMAAAGDWLDRFTRFLEQSGKRHVVVDFRHAPYFGSNLLSVLLRLWHRVRELGGKMVLCNLQAADLRMLEATHLQALWSTTATLTEALDRLEND